MAEKYRIDIWKEVYPPNPAMLRIKLEREGFRVTQWTDRPGAFYGLHKHGEDQSHWIISGSLEVTVNNRAFVLTAGDRDFMPADTYHTARVVGDVPVFYLIGESIEPVERATDIAVEHVWSTDAETLVGRMMAVEKILSTAGPSVPEKKKRKRGRSKQKRP